MDYTKKAGAEPLPGYKLIEPLGKGGFGEVWKCEVPGGLFKAIKFVHGKLNGLDPENTAQQEFQALERVKVIRHPFVLSLERAEVIDGELVMVMELADKNLEDRMLECQGDGLPGIPQEELLPLLLDAAEALDLLNFEHDLQHLDIKPSNLFLMGNHVKLADFGLVQSLEEIRSDADGQANFGMTPLYSPPEMLQGKGSRHCDQYSLAIVYQQLLTGVLPFDGKNARQLMMQHLAGEPNLDSLEESERPLVSRALAKDPDGRFSSCQEFIQALILGAEQPPADQQGHLKNSSRYLRLPPKELLNDGGGNRKSTSSFLLPAKEKRNTKFLKQTPAVSSFQEATKPSGSFILSADAQLRNPPQLPNCEVLECLYAGALGGLWKARSAEGGQLLVRALPEVDGSAEALQSYAEAIQQIDHASLPEQELLEQDGRLFIVMDYSKPLLLDRFRKSVAEGRPGVSRPELLNFIAKAARALDEIAEKHQAPHLNLNPLSLLSQDHGVHFTDFGLVTFYWSALDRKLSELNPRFAAPEVLAGDFSPASDQYSLALIYAEMLSGFHPRPKVSRERKRADSKVDLTFMPSAEQVVLRRALHSDPTKRFAGCREFVEALGVRFKSAGNQKQRNLPALLPLSQLHDDELRPEPELPDAAEYFQEFFYRATNVSSFHTSRYCQYVKRTDHSLECRVSIRLPHGLLREKLAGFAREWKGTLDSSRANSFVFRLPCKGGMFARLVGSPGGVEVRLDAQSSERSLTIHSGARIQVEAYGSDAAFQLLQSKGPELIESLCSHLQAAKDQGSETRVCYSDKLCVYPVLADRQIGHRIEAVSKDMSTNGITFLLPKQLAAEKVYLQLEPSPHGPPFVILANIVHNRNAGDDLWELGAVVNAEGDTVSSAEQVKQSDVELITVN